MHDIAETLPCAAIPFAERQANQRLIAAATDMFKLIEDIIDASGPYPDLDGHPIVSRAHALHSKARGQA